MALGPVNNETLIRILHIARHIQCMKMTLNMYNKLCGVGVILTRFFEFKIALQKILLLAKSKI